MGKTLVIAEKPSVGRDLAAALPRSFSNHEGYLEGDGYVVTWAVGHLVGLPEPEEHDERFKQWRLVDLPIVPEASPLKPRDAQTRRQLSRVTKLLNRSAVQ